MNNVMLTTYNNPYDPFTNYDEWYCFDLQNGTDCCGYLARMVDSIESENKKIAKTNNYFVDDETTEDLINKAIEKITTQDSLTYLAVKPNDCRYQLSIDEFNKTIPELVEQD